MSLDHLLFRAPGPGPMSSWPPDPPPALPSSIELRSRLEQLLPDLRWEQWRTSWLGRSGPGGQGLEVQLTDRSEVERLCRALDLLAVDPGFAVFRPDTGRWEHEA